jgi:hypothetical protein
MSEHEDYVAERIATAAGDRHIVETDFENHRQHAQRLVFPQLEQLNAIAASLSYTQAAGRRDIHNPLDPGHRGVALTAQANLADKIRQAETEGRF